MGVAFDTFGASGGVNKRGPHAKLGQEILLRLMVRPERVEPAGLHVGERVAVAVADVGDEHSNGWAVGDVT